MPKKQLTIDPDIHAAAEAYVNKQLDTMGEHGCRLVLTPNGYAQLIYDVAKYPQEIRNLNEKARNKRKMPHACCYAGPDGWSLMCLYCGTYEYIKNVDATGGTAMVVCSKCQHTHKWEPTEVACANPKHNDNEGCGNPLCWKFPRKEPVKLLGPSLLERLAGQEDEL